MKAILKELQKLQMQILGKGFSMSISICDEGDYSQASLFYDEKCETFNFFEFIPERQSTEMQKLKFKIRQLLKSYNYEKRRKSNCGLHIQRSRNSRLLQQA